MFQVLVKAIEIERIYEYNMYCLWQLRSAQNADVWPSNLESVTSTNIINCYSRGCTSHIIVGISWSLHQCHISVEFSLMSASKLFQLLSEFSTVLPEVEGKWGTRGESPTLPAWPALAGWTSDADEAWANGRRRRRRQRRLLGRPANRDEQRSQIGPSSVKKKKKKTSDSVNMEGKFADFSGKWTMKSSENFEELLKVLGE